MIKDVTLTVDNLKILGQLFLPENAEPPFPGVILCHGVPSGNVDPADGGYPLLAKTISENGLAAYTFRFRGTGGSEGNFDIIGWTRDLAAVIDYIWKLPEIDDRHIALAGFSAGAAVSIYTGSQDKRISAVVACAAPADFTNISDVDQPGLMVNYFRKIGIIRDPEYPASLEDWLNDFRKINALHCVADIAPRPLLLIHARRDNVVPVINSKKLYAAAGEPKKMVILEGSEHRLRKNEKAVETVITWLKKQIKYNL
jgi:uncharacterized protein